MSRCCFTVSNNRIRHINDNIVTILVSCCKLPVMAPACEISVYSSMFFSSSASAYAFGDANEASLCLI